MAVAGESKILLFQLSYILPRLLLMDIMAKLMIKV